MYCVFIFSFHSTRTVGLSTDRRDGERHDSASPVGGGVPTNRDDPAPPPPPRRRAQTSEIFVYLQSDDSVTTSSIESISTGAGVGLGANEGEEEEDDGVGGSVPRESRRGKGGGILRLSRSFLSSVVKRSSLSRQRLQREPSQELLDVISPHATEDWDLADSKVHLFPFILISMDRLELQVRYCGILVKYKQGLREELRRRWKHLAGPWR